MFSGKRDLSHRHDAPAWSSGGDTAAKSRRAKNTGGNDPTVNNANPTWDRAAQAISDHLDAPNSAIRGHHGIIKVDDHHAIVRDAICEESLHAAIRANGAVSIEVVNGHVRKHPNINRRVK
jgi:hypothetical protein